ncbi:amidohydrolase family protein [bacterium]|nr:amidohydrolase family protein [bacterium]
MKQELTKNIKMNNEQLKQFKEIAMETISNTPSTRLSPAVIKVIEKNDYVFDAHCHIFDGKCIDVKYFVIRLIGSVPEKFLRRVWRLLTRREIFKLDEMSRDEMLDILYDDNLKIAYEGDFDRYLAQLENDIETELEQFDQEKELASILDFDWKNFLRRLYSIIKILKTSRMSKVYKAFHDKYAVQNVEGGDLLTIVLGMDLNMSWSSAIQESFDEQFYELLNLSYRKPIVPFLPLDPRRAERTENEDGNEYRFNHLYDKFLEAFDKNNDRQYFGVKIYPALGYLPSDSRLQPLFEICAAKGIPVVTHCGGEVVSSFKWGFDVDRFGEIIRCEGDSRKERARWLNEPLQWKPILEKHEGLKLNLGHFGSASAWSKPHGETAHRKEEIFDLMKDHSVYTDFSFNLESESATNNFVEKLKGQDEQSEQMQNRCMFGTDFWVVLPMSNLIDDTKQFILKVGEHKKRMLKDNVLEFLGINS